jgi:hypothetical protein
MPYRTLEILERLRLAKNSPIQITTMKDMHIYRCQPKFNINTYRGEK